MSSSGSDRTAQFTPGNAGLTQRGTRIHHTGATRQIEGATYSFTSAPIAKALVEAHKRGVKVDVLLDKSQRTEKYSSADFLLHAGIATRIDDRHAIAHNKIMIIDGEIVITGSFDFTKNAEENNAENLLVIRSKALAETYTENWERHAEHCEAYAGRAAKEADPAPVPAANEDQPAKKRVEAADGVAAGFVSSKNSQVFHRPGCESADKISAKNVVRYATRDEAIAAGKRPCQECRP